MRAKSRIAAKIERTREGGEPTMALAFDIWDRAKSCDGEQTRLLQMVVVRSQKMPIIMEPSHSASAYMFDAMGRPAGLTSDAMVKAYMTLRGFDTTHVKTDC